jgi:hypothetical protein
LSNDEAHLVRKWSPLVLSFSKLTGCCRHCCSWQYMPLDMAVEVMVSSCVVISEANRLSQTLAAVVDNICL